MKEGRLLPKGVGADVDICKGAKAGKLAGSGMGPDSADTDMYTFAG